MERYNRQFQKQRQLCCNLQYILWSGPGSSNAVWLTPSLSTIFSFQLTYSQPQFSLGGFWGGRAPQFQQLVKRVLGLVSQEYNVLVFIVQTNRESTKWCSTNWHELAGLLKMNLKPRKSYFRWVLRRKSKVNESMMGYLHACKKSSNYLQDKRMGFTHYKNAELTISCCRVNV